MLVQKFSIRGLHGYKDVSIDFQNKATIVVAENGSGKTTILSALNALLTRRLRRLGSVEFESMELVFSNAEVVRVEKKMVSQSKGRGEDLAERLAAEAGVSSEDIINYVIESYSSATRSDVRMHPMVRKLHLSLSSPFDAVLEKLDAIQEGLRSEEPELTGIKEEIKDRLGETRVLFLPTYRRVELPLARPPSRGREDLGGRRYGRRLSGGLDARFSGMNFGLSDVEYRLGELADEVERRSNLEYRGVSARMINQLLQQQISRSEAEQFPLPDIDSLEMFFSRVERRSAIANIESLRRFYESEDSGSEQRIFLRYFLGQLSQVIEQTRAIEALLRRFVDACNQYLKASSDEKTLAYVPESMKVEVRNLWTGTEVEMDSLSSGEKQIISLLAELYLDPARKIILIDEPEISLSLDWQRKVLLDVQEAESVEQFLAITHSPFVFDNELGPFAGPLRVERKRHRKA